jgi:hypothetical protein
VVKLRYVVSIEITKETNPSDNNKSQAIEIRKGTNSSLKSIKKY